MAPPVTITPAIYGALLAAFRTGASAGAAASAAGCTREIAVKAWRGHYASTYAWAPAIEAVIAGTAHEPILPKVWPPPKVQPLAVVRPIRDPSAPTLTVSPPTDADGILMLPEDTGEAQAQLLADLRNVVYARFVSSSQADPDFSAFNSWLAKAMRKHAEMLSTGQVDLTVEALEQAGRLALMAATIREKEISAVERLIALEKKWNPPKPSATVRMSHDEAKKRAAAEVARWRAALERKAATLPAPDKAVDG